MCFYVWSAYERDSILDRQRADGLMSRKSAMRREGVFVHKKIWLVVLGLMLPGVSLAQAPESELLDGKF